MKSTSPSTLVAPWAVGLLAFVFRLAAFNGFENDHFMHVAWAQQVLLGAWPGRDFAEPGMPLMVLLSAAAQWTFPGFLSEAVLGITLLAVAAGLVCTVTTAVTASRLAGIVAGLATIAWYPRFYGYPKLLVPAVTLWLLLRYARRQSPSRLWALAAGSVAAFLLRHDLGVMAALATLAGIAVLSHVSPRARVTAAARFVGAGLVLVAPYLFYLQMVEGIGEHVRVATEFGKAEQHQFLWSASLEPESGGLAVSAGSWQVSPEGLLFWVYTALLVAGGALVLQIADRQARSVLAAWLAFAVLFRVVILRHPLSARLPDVAVVTSIGAVAVGHHVLTRLLAWRRTRPMIALAGAVLAALVVVPVVHSAWTVANVGDRLAQAGVRRGVGGVLRSARSVVRAWDGRSWSPYWPEGEEPPAVDYLRRCLSSTDRVLVTWFAPDYFVFSRKGFAAGHALFYPASFATDRDQAVMLDRLSRESVPVVLVNQSELEAFSRAFPRLAAYIAAHYTVRASFLHNDSVPIGVAVRNDLHPRGSFGTGAWACGFDEESSGGSRAQSRDSMTAVVRLARAGGAAVLLLALGTAAASHVVPWYVLALGACALAGGLWRPADALPWVLVVVPWGERLAPVPVRASELVLWAFFAGLGLRLTERPVPVSPWLRRMAVPALLFLGVTVVSWMRVELQQPGVPDWPAAGAGILRLVPADYLVTAGRAPHTAAMLQVALAVSVFLAVLGLARRDAAVPGRVLFSVAAGGLLAAVVSVLAVPVIYFTTGDWNEIDRYISVTRSRGAFHLKDVNAAGSQDILAALLSLALAPAGRAARIAWRVGQVAIVVALWMSGSRAAITAGAAGVAVWFVVAWLAGRGLAAPRLSPRVLGACGVAVIVALTGSVRLGNAQATTGSASLSLSLRGEFLRTSLDMMATAPISGVGIGTYYQRSNQFMPPTLRATYGRENAHNYFMQVWAELGIIGLLAFLWWLGRALGAGWIRVRREGWRGPAFAALCGCGVYLLTCVTGHPFLVVEVAALFWAALGATAALGAESPET